VSKTLIIPDIHNKWKKAQDLIDKINPARVVALGDLFDSFDDSPEILEESCEWFVNFIHNPKNVFIMGNHELSYRFPCYRCSGYKQWKQMMMDDFIKLSDWNKCVYYYNLDDIFLLTHAGLHSRLLLRESYNLFENKSPDAYKQLLVDMGNLSRHAVKSADRGDENNFFAPGRSRGGTYKVGGIMWCDSREFVPIKGLNQIFGHTKQIFPQLNTSNAWNPVEFTIKCKLEDILSNETFNLNLDTSLNHFAIWDSTNKVLTVDSI